MKGGSTFALTNSCHQRHLEVEGGARRVVQIDLLLRHIKDQLQIDYLNSATPFFDTADLDYLLADKCVPHSLTEDRGLCIAITELEVTLEHLKAHRLVLL